MTDISVIILAGKEELHIRRCLEKLAPLEPKQVFVVESQKGDRTHEIALETAKSLGWAVCDYQQDGANPLLITHHSTLITCFHSWPGMYSLQFNWALDNLPITTKWVLRLDADEYYLPDAIEEIKTKLPTLPVDVTGIVHKRRTCLFGGWAKHGTYPVKMVRLFRCGKAICEERYMDEHMQLSEGQTVEFEYDLVDENLNPFDWWREKHIGYAKREAQDYLERFSKLGWFAKVDLEGVPLSAMDRTKVKYYHSPRYLRVLVYWAKRYILGLGFLDGACGWRWNWWQGLWYRWQVDREIARLRRACLTTNYTNSTN